MIFLKSSYYFQQATMRYDYHKIKIKQILRRIGEIFILKLIYVVSRSYENSLKIIYHLNVLRLTICIIIKINKSFLSYNQAIIAGESQWSLHFHITAYLKNAVSYSQEFWES